MLVIDDHLLRDVLSGDRSADLGGLGRDGLAITGLWLFRLAASFANPTVAGKLSAPVAELPEDLQTRFRADLVALPPEIVVLSLRELAWPMALLRVRHRTAGRPLSAAMVEALAAANDLHAGIAVSKADVGPQLRAAARADKIPFHTI